MKYGIVFFISLFISLPTLAKVEQYDDIVAAHQSHFQKKNPGKEAQYFELGSPKPTGPGQSFLVVDGKTLKDNQSSIDDFFKENPDVTLLLDLREGDGFVEKKCLNLRQSDLKASIHKLSLSNINNDVTSIGGGFLSDCSELTALDLSPLSQLTSIGDWFLYSCSGLTALDLSHLSKLTSIGSGFLFGCSGLTALDLSPLRELTSIGYRFLFCCRGLTALDLSPLRQITSIGHDFLSYCSGLTALDLSPLSKLTSIGSSFLSGCRGLTALDLSHLRELTSIGGGFLSGCRGLTALDLSHLSKLTSIGDSFLSDCSGLTALDLSPLRELTSIGVGFLSGCRGLTALDLSPLRELTSIGGGFLSGCSGLTALDLSHLRELISIGNYFLDGCSGLTALDLSPLRKLTSIDYRFLFCCRGLTSLDLSPLSQLTSIGPDFLCGSDNLVKILNPELTRRNVLATVVGYLRNSNNPLQQQEGHRLYQTYLLELPEDLKELMAGLNLEKIRANVPLALPDITTLSHEQVVTAFDELIVTLRQFVDDYNQKIQNDDAVLNKEAARLTFHDELYEGHLKSQLQNLFIDDTVRVTWRIRDDQRPELRIAFKHLLRELQQDKPLNALTDMNQLLHAFAHCESRNVSVVNQILMQRGLGQKTENSKLGKVWGWVNAQKLICFANYMGEDTDLGAHEYGRKFTSINAAIGLPVAVRSFKERISQLSDEEMQNILGEFLAFFNRGALIEAFWNENPLSPKEARDLLGAEEEYERLKPYNEDDDDVEGYYVDVSGVKREEFNYKTTKFSKGETERLLTVLGVIK